MRAIADEQTAVERHAARDQVVDLRDQFREIQNRAVSDHDPRLGAEHAGGDVLQCVAPAADRDRVPRIRAALVACDDLEPIGEEVDDLPLPFVAPLGAHDREVCAHRRQAVAGGGDSKVATRNAKASWICVLSRKPCAPS